MNPTTRSELFEVLAELSEMYPDWRIGQMLGNLATFAGKTSPEALWDMEDDEFIAAAKRHMERRRSANPEPTTTGA